MAHSHLNLIWFKKTRLPGKGSNRRISSESIHLALSSKPSSLVIQRSLYFQSYSQTVNNLLETENIPAWEGVKKVKQNSLKYTHVRFARILLINSTPIESRRLSSMQAIHPSIILLCFNSVRVILLILMFFIVSVLFELGPKFERWSTYYYSFKNPNLLQCRSWISILLKGRKFYPGILFRCTYRHKSDLPLFFSVNLLR